MDVQVKVCGVQDEAGAQACVDANADLVGFNFVPSSKRFIEPEQARAWVERVNADRAVGVFRNQPQDHVLRTSRLAGVTWIQLHGDETPGMCEALRSEGFRVIKAISVRAQTTIDSVRAYEGVTELRLFDAANPGSGRVFDHARLNELSPERPFFLAGGLTPENVREAVATVRPDGVDTASGVERDGRMDPLRVAAFCREARTA